MDFGDIRTGGAFARGTSPGGVSSGGVYAFDVGGGNFILGVQPAEADFTTGEFILRLQNSTGAIVTELEISFDIWYINNADRANSLEFSYSPDNGTYIDDPGLAFATPLEADAGAVWRSRTYSAVLSGLNLASGDYFYLKWTGSDAGGTGSWDEYGLDNIQVTTPITDEAPTITSTVPADGAVDVAAGANISLTFSEPVTVTGDWFLFECSLSGSRGVEDAAVSGGPTTWTINPDSDFAWGETCLVAVVAAQVTDQDGSADNMPADHAFSFTTLAPASGWVINEIHADPDPIYGDANNDGLVNSGQDEFVELVNNTGHAVDISGWFLADEQGPRYVFPAGTVVPDQCVTVVFGGGTPAGSFGNALVQTANSLGLNNRGDTLTLRDAATAVVTSYHYGSEGGDNQSVTRCPDVTGLDPLIRHSTATGASGALFSPGVQVDGTAFPGCSNFDLPPAVTATVPASEALSVPVTSTITITFSEVVTITPNAFTLECPAGRPLSFDFAPGPPGNARTFVLAPVTDLPDQSLCTVAVHQSEITDQDGSPDNPTTDYILSFTTAGPTLPPDPLLISEFLYDGTTASTEGDEFVEVCNPNPKQVNLAGYKMGDEETCGGGESMYLLPDIILNEGDCLVVAKKASDFQARFPSTPIFYQVSDLQKYTTWGRGSWSLSNTGDELLLLGPNDEVLDSVAYRNGDYATLGLEPDASAPQPDSLQRIWPLDTNSMPNDFVRTEPNPGQLTESPDPPAYPPPPAALPGGMRAYWGGLHAHTTFSDGAGPPHYALAMARAAGLHFYAITDHGWRLTSSQWDRTLNQAQAATVPGQFVALRGLEWTPASPGHLNIFNSSTLVSHTTVQFDTIAKFYAWLAANPAVIAQFNHPDPGYGGTFSDFAYDAAAAPRISLLEIGNHAQGYRTYEASFVQANTAGWKTGPANNGDTHTANWGNDTIGRTGLVAPALTEADLLAAMRARRVFSTEDSNLAITLRSREQWMGQVLTGAGSIPLTVNFVDSDPEPLTLHLYDSNLLLASRSFTTSTGQWTTVVGETRPGHFYWVKAVQADGNLAYTAPLWIAGQLDPEPLVINEILPSPADWDWDGNGIPDYTDEWIELYNPLDRPVGLGGWRLVDASAVSYNIPLEATIPARGYAVFYQAQTGLALNNGGDSLQLVHPNGTVVDTFTYGHSPGYDEAWCRLPDGGSGWSDDCGPSPNGPNWEKAPAGPLAVTIFEARRLTPGAWVRVKGQVTAPPGLLGNRTMYIQDGTAGIMIYLPKEHRLQFNLGDKVEVVGNLRLFHEEAEIAVDDRDDVRGRGPGQPVHPLPIVTTSMLEPYEGMLVMLQGAAVRFRGRTTFWVDDGTDPAKVYVRSSTGIRKPFIKLGTPITVTGIVSQYSADKANPSREDYRLLPRYQFDLLAPVSSPPKGWPALLPETG